MAQDRDWRKGAEVSAYGTSCDGNPAVIIAADRASSESRIERLPGSDTKVPPGSRTPERVDLDSIAAVVTAPNHALRCDFSTV